MPSSARRMRSHLLDLSEREGVNIAQHGHDQALRRGHSDGDVRVVTVDDLIPIYDCIYCWHLRMVIAVDGCTRLHRQPDQMLGILTLRLHANEKFCWVLGCTRC